MLQSQTTQRVKARYYQSAKRLSNYEKHEIQCPETFYYIGKNQCPKCKEKGYLKIINGCFVIQHRIKKVKRKNKWITLWRYCYLPSITSLIRTYNRESTRLNNKQNPDIKKREYDKKRYEAIKTAKTQHRNLRTKRHKINKQQP